MKEFLIYEGKAAVVLAVFWLFYKLLLSKEKLHRLNRRVLVGTVVASFILPLCVITVHKPVQAQPQMQSREVHQAVQPEMAAPGAEIDAETQARNAVEPAVTGVDWWSLGAVVYLIGVVAVLARVVVDIIGLRKKISIGEHHEDSSGNSVIVLDEDVAPFSWMHYIFLSRADYETANSYMLSHERAHIRLGHAKELLAVECLSAMQWFNPSMWLLKSDLKTIYEYEADDAVLGGGADIKEYQYSLIRKAVGAGGYTITNNFNYSTLKKRINMMLIPRQSLWRGLRALYVLPLLCGALALNAETVYDRADNENAGDKKEKTARLKITDENGEPVYYFNNRKVSPDKLEDKVRAVINLKRYNRSLDVLSKENRIEMSIDESVDMSKVIDLEQFYRSCGLLGVKFDNEETVKKAKQQHPEKYEEKPLPFGFVEPVAVVAYGKVGSVQDGLATDEEPVEYFKLTKQPVFNGGNLDEFAHWIIQHANYPANAKAEGLEGTVDVIFKVNSDGRVSDVKAEGEHACRELKAAAAKLIASSPRWTPGEIDGKPVATTVRTQVYYDLK